MNLFLMRAALVLLLAGSAVMMGCAGGDGDRVDVDTTMTDTTDALGTAGMQDRAVAELQPTAGNTALGTATFTSLNGSVRIEATITGLAPGEHGFHVHETGDCSAPDASSAGGHFNPQDSRHGAPDGQDRHVGDLGNIEAGPDSTAQVSHVDNLITLSGPNSVVGKALVVHAGADDLTSQPSGDSGDRVACGVIELDGAAGMDRGRGTARDTVPAM